MQQKEQEYYNVYVPGACSGKIVLKKEVGSETVNGDLPKYERANSVSNIVLYGDNINKVPKELADVGPTEEVYGSETLLYPRVVTRYGEGSQIESRFSGTATNTNTNNAGSGSAHSHSMSATFSGSGNAASNSSSSTTSNFSGSAANPSVLQPYLTIYYIIKT